MYVNSDFVGYPVAGKATIGKWTCKSTKWTTDGADNMHSNGAPQKEGKMLFYGGIHNKPLPSTSLRFA
uniref:Uncharacterized protein n=1 Tax=Romanomermis culicivorax TaxID=13658 RepID=A0A915HYS9_ROMCU